MAAEVLQVCAYRAQEGIVESIAATGEDEMGGCNDRQPGGGCPRRRKALSPVVDRGPDLARCEGGER
jgi:hypothetical protein